MDESKTELEMSLDQSLKLGMRRAQIGESVRPHNCMIRAKPDDDVLSFVRKWAERNDIHFLFSIGQGWMENMSTIMKTDF